MQYLHMCMSFMHNKFSKFSDEWHHNTVGVQIFVGTIFCGLNFCGDKFSWVVVPTKFNPHEKLFTIAVHETRMVRRVEDVEYQKTPCDKAISLRYRR